MRKELFDELVENQGAEVLSLYERRAPLERARSACVSHAPNFAPVTRGAGRLSRTVRLTVRAVPKTSLGWFA